MPFWSRKSRSHAETPRLHDLLHGYRATCLIVTAVQIGLVQALAEGDLRDDLLAARLGAHAPSLRRFVRALTVIGVVTSKDGHVALTSTGRSLLKDQPGPWHSAVLIGEEYLPAWSDLRHSVLTGEPAFRRVFGMSAWEHRQRHPELNEAFNRMGNTAPRTVDALSAAFDFSACDVVVDVGGGRGQLLAALLARSPRVRGVVFDLPHVVAGVSEVARAAGLGDRCQAVGGSFFESVPAGGDVYLLQHVLHDWDDDDCVTILRNVRTAIAPAGTLLVVEQVLSDDGRDDMPATVMLDIHMLAVLGGRERTGTELEALFRSAGFEPTRTPSARGELVVLAAKPSAATTPAPG